MRLVVWVRVGIEKFLYVYIIDELKYDISIIYMKEMFVKYKEKSLLNVSALFCCV